MEDQRNNEPEAFDRLTPLAQETLRAWLRMTLVKTRTVRAGVGNHSYGLKHAAEEAIGDDHVAYISNGELKGAMVAEGYDHEVIDGGLNWLFNCRRTQPTVEEVVEFKQLCMRLRVEKAERIAARRASLEERW